MASGPTAGLIGSTTSSDRLLTVARLVPDSGIAGPPGVNETAVSETPGVVLEFRPIWGEVVSIRKAWSNELERPACGGLSGSPITRIRTTW